MPLMIPQLEAIRGRDKLLFETLDKIVRHLNKPAAAAPAAPTVAPASSAGSGSASVSPTVPANLSELLDSLNAAVATIPAGAADTPLIESGAGAVGASTKYAREDHVHPAAAGASNVHDEPLTDGSSNFIFAGGDIVVVVGVPN